MNIKHGLTQEEAKKNQELYGTNTLLAAKRPNPIGVFFSQFNDWLVIILITAAIISIIIEPNDLLESSIIMAILFLNATIGTIQEIKAFKTLDGLKELSLNHSTVLRDGKVKKILSKELTIDDCVLLEKGDSIDADMLLIEANSIRVDEAALTGESLPIEKTKNQKIYSGTFMVSGNGKAIVKSIGMKTRIGEIAHSLLQSHHDKTPLEEKLEQIGKIIAVIAVAICVGVFFIELALGIELFEAFKSAISLAVAAIPEGLATVVTVCLALGVKKMANQNAIIKKLEAVETLGCSNIVCSDKTGTLTENKQTIVEIYEDETIPINALKEEPNKLLSYAHLAANPTNIEISDIIDPVDKAIENLWQERKYTFIEHSVIEVLPFDSERKYMMVEVDFGKEKVKIYKGAFDILDKIVKKEPNIMQKKAIQEMMKKGYRVIAVCTDFEIIGLIAMEDKPREDVISTVQMAKEASVRTVMITGDHLETAYAIANRLGIAKDKSEAISKERLDQMTDEELVSDIIKFNVYARVSPADKVRIVKAWQQRGCIVAMTGDGINDAPALKCADIGCAMGNGTEIAKNASDMILVDSNYKTIIESIKNGRGIYENIKKCTKYLLASNIGEVLTIVLVTMLSLVTKVNLGIPLASLQLLWINIITDSLPAFGLGLEPADESIMKRPPRMKKDGFFANKLGIEILFIGVCIGLLTVISYFIGLKINPRAASSMAFVTISTSQLFHSYNCKTEESVFQKNILKNRFLNSSFVIGIALEMIVLYLNGLNSTFSLVPLTFVELSISILLAFMIILISEIWKKTNKKKYPIAFYLQ